MRCEIKILKLCAIYSGMNYREIDIAYDNCMFGDVKFLYISPERLKTDMFREKIRNMNVNLLAIDEAHCISQWGYDFRPSYLEIIAVREVLPHGAHFGTYRYSNFPMWCLIFKIS
jgi:ATP-dependent DNA helicase RecQ